MNLFLNKLYSIEENTHTRIRVKLNSNHEIFSGHFPDNPILPGVCALQIAKEVFALPQIIEIDNIKYNCPINPNIIQTIVLLFVKERRQIKIFDDNNVLLVEINNIHFLNT